MPLPPARDHRISRADAASLTRRHRDAVPAAERGGMFFRKPVEELLAQKGCEGIRIYHGRNDDGTAAMILVGVDKDGADMEGGVLLEFHYPCPPFCPPPDGDLSP
jgi:hypothetical protein